MPRYSGEFCRSLAEFHGLEYVEHDEAMTGAFGSPEAADEAYGADFFAACAVFRSYCDETSLYYYAADREDFFPGDGVEGAVNAGRSRVMMEDMS